MFETDHGAIKGVKKSMLMKLVCDDVSLMARIVQVTEPSPSPVDAFWPYDIDMPYALIVRPMGNPFSLFNQASMKATVDNWERTAFKKFVDWRFN
jgi:hypothetical protein